MADYSSSSKEEIEEVEHNYSSSDSSPVSRSDSFSSESNDAEDFQCVDFLERLIPNVLSQPAPLQLQCLMYIIGHLYKVVHRPFLSEVIEEGIPTCNLSLLSHIIRKQLLLLLPAVDVCKLEGTSFTNDLSMNEIWEIIYKDRIPHDVMKYFKEQLNRDVYIPSVDDQGINWKVAYFTTVFSCNQACKSLYNTDLKSHLKDCQHYIHQEHFLPSLIYSINPTSDVHQCISDFTLCTHEVYCCAPKILKPLCFSNFTPFHYRNYFTRYSDVQRNLVTPLNFKLHVVDINNTQLPVKSLIVESPSEKYIEFNLKDFKEPLCIGIVVKPVEDVIAVLDHQKNIEKAIVKCSLGILDYWDVDVQSKAIECVSSLFGRPSFKELTFHCSSNLLPKDVALLFHNFFFSPYPISLSLSISCPTEFSTDLSEPLLFNEEQHFKCLKLDKCIFSPSLASILPPNLTFKTLIFMMQDQWNAVSAFSTLNSIKVNTITLGQCRVNKENVHQLCSLFKIVTAQSWYIGIDIINEKGVLDILCSGLDKIKDAISHLVISCSGDSIVPILDVIFNSSSLKHLELGLCLVKCSKDIINTVHTLWKDKGNSVQLKEISLVYIDGHDIDIGSATPILQSMAINWFRRDKMGLLPSKFQF